MEFNGFKTEDIEALAQAAKDVLESNWTGAFTQPSSGLYPHQWSWDAVFIAIGYSHFNQERAEQELRHLFNGQWQNGMVPHIVFSDEKLDTYFPGSDFWQAERSPHAPKRPKTSGICQPPIHATGVRYMLEHAPDRQQAVDFASEMFPRLKAWHAYLKRERDPFDEGLVYIRHPWESGQDNSPIWDSVFENFSLENVELPKYERKDITVVDPSERPSNQEYDNFVFLVDFSRKRNYDEARIRDDNCPFMVQDVLFNTLFCQASQDLAEIARLIGEDPELFDAWAEQTASAMNDKLWHEDAEANMYLYADFDLQARQKLPTRVLSGFLPLLAGAPNERRQHLMFQYLNSHCFCQLEGECYPVPSYDRYGEQYTAGQYWRGPVWINMNWLLCMGLERYGYQDYVKHIKKAMTQLTHKSGFREYYDTESGVGYGINGFSWSASLLLSMLYHKDTSVT